MLDVLMGRKGLVAWRALAACVALASSSAAFAASFNCKGATSDSEELICSDGVLSQLDSQLSGVYALALNDVVPIKRQEIIREQRKWVTEVRDACNGKECLEKSYLRRISELSNVDGKAFYVTDQQQRSQRVDELKADVRSIGLTGELIACDRIVQVESVADKSYGAICSVNGKSLMICNDSTIGSLSMKFYGFTVNGPSLANFVEKNCPSGG
jgi:uncharacterized protein